MIITIINLGKDSVSINGLKLTLGAYEHKTITTDGDVKKSTAEEMDAYKKNGVISYSTAEDTSIPDEFEDTQIAMLNSLVKVRMIDAPNVSGGGTTQVVGFALTNINDIPIKLSTYVELNLWQDVDLSILATSASLTTASKGTIIATNLSGTALKVKTDANGEFECVLTDLIDETVYLACDQTSGGPALITTSKDSVTFSV